MAFNLARYNLQPYNTAGEKTRKISVSIAETVSASVGTSSKISPLTIINERVNASVSGELTRKIRKASISETIEELVVDALASVVMNLALVENVETESDISANDSLAVSMIEIVSTESDINAEIKLPVSITESVTTSSNLGAVIKTDPQIYELVDATASLEALDMKICHIGTTADKFILKPGERILINAETYNVVLNGENATYYQSGDWIDELNRQTESIRVTASSGVKNLTVSILYTERYL